MSTLAEMTAIGEKAAKIQHALKLLKQAEQKLALINKYAKEHAGKCWKPELRLEKSNYSYRDITVEVVIPYEYVVRQVIDEVHGARRYVVSVGGECPTASEQVQRQR